MNEVLDRLAQSLDAHARPLFIGFLCLVALGACAGVTWALAI